MTPTRLQGVTLAERLLREIAEEMRERKVGPKRQFTSPTLRAWADRIEAAAALSGEVDGVDLARVPPPWSIDPMSPHTLLDANGDPIAQFYGPDADRKQAMAAVMRLVNAATPQPQEGG